MKLFLACLLLAATCSTNPTNAQQHLRALSDEEDFQMSMLATEIEKPGGLSCSSIVNYRIELLEYELAKLRRGGCVPRTDCACVSKRQVDYRGTVAKTVTGNDCQRWDSQSPNTHDRTPDRYKNAGLEENYCRNPDGDVDRAWCYNGEGTNPRYELCAVSNCDSTECITPVECGCTNMAQMDYRGTMAVTKSGLICQAWNSQLPQGHTLIPGDYPNAGLDSNYCRNPDGSDKAWCYNSVEKDNPRWEYCDVPYCDLTQPVTIDTCDECCDVCN